MPKLALTNNSNFTVGGGKILGGSPDANSQGSKIARVGDPVEPHGSDDDEHQSAIIIEGSPTMFVNGIAVAREGDLASCGHRIVSSGGTVNVDG